MNYRKLFREHKIIRDLSLVQFIAYFGAWFSNVAIYTMLVDFGSTEMAISVVTAMHFIPAILIAPLSGAIIDRVKIKPLMIFLLSTELLMTILFLTIDNKEQIWFLMILIFIRMSAASMFFSTEMSLLAKLLNGKPLQMANEIHSIIWSFTYAVGMAVSGFVVNSFGHKTAFIIDAVIFAIALFVFIRIDFVVKASQTTDKIFQLIKDGFIYIKNHKLILHLIFLHSSVGLTSFDALITILAKNEYKYIISVPLAIGLSNAVRAVALMFGPMFISKYVTKENLHYLLVFQGLSIILWSLTQSSFYISLISLFIVGLSTTTLWSFTYALLQNNCDEKYIGRVISYNDMFFMLSCVVTTLFIGLMASLISTDIITILLGIGFLAFAFYYTRILKWI
ncbi:MAG: MFS transporter [Arcobacter sp.]|uniref:Proton antiporter protein, major facilitator superfamily n=1 Tax=Arcobacter defluvii TaxID=873191 RepID=A0AAE7BIP0_9BACT|nr:MULTISPECIES: MFS transporter [Arcobacter]MDY3201030.1 MFS transporter [Arcobacter sp.]QKF78459.1 proton antiporter protein, major facilitator superfamily [Arcobacter defluvii]RXI31345.1 MFS transporter [Arcobacter defluvii]